METTYADSWSDMAQPCDMDLWVMKWRSAWPIFHGPVILSYILKTIWCMNSLIWDYDSVWPDIWPQNKCRSLWPIFHDPVILNYILTTIWCMNIILGDYGSVWPQNKCTSLWPIFHGPLILSYISKTIWWMSVIFLDQRTSGPVNAHLTPGPGIYFNAFIHVYSSRPVADNPLGTNVDVNRKPLSLCRFVASFKTISLKYDFKHILNDFIHVYSPGARAENPWEQTFDVNRKPLSLQPFVASFKQISLNSDFIHIFLCFSTCI